MMALSQPVNWNLACFTHHEMSGYKFTRLTSYKKKGCMIQSPQFSHFREVIEMENLYEEPCHCSISNGNLILWSIINCNLM